MTNIQELVAQRQFVVRCNLCCTKTKVCCFEDEMTLCCLLFLMFTFPGGGLAGSESLVPCAWPQLPRGEAGISRSVRGEC